MVDAEVRVAARVVGVLRLAPALGHRGDLIGLGIGAEINLRVNFLNGQ